MSKEGKNIELLVVDDERETLHAMARLFRKLQINVTLFEEPELALENILHSPPDIIISDYKMPGMTGIELLTQVKRLHPQIPSVLLSAYADFDTVGKAMHSGVVNKFVSKPWSNEELKFVITKLLDGGEQGRDDHQKVVDEKLPFSQFHGIYTQSNLMLKVFDVIRNAATSNAPIFIQGETGTGKELVAKACHLESFQNAQPFIAFNCANFSEHLMESQLFGHVKGAFTGATSDQPGLFSAAENGTIFLDEVTTLPLSLQAKLLRVLQEREFSPLGSVGTKTFNAHIISASSTGLLDAVNTGTFREDLMYRLNVIGIQLPALRERADDVELLASIFLNRFCKVEKKRFSGFGNKAISRLKQYDWPGNIRQLENLIHNLVILNQGKQISDEMVQNSMISLPNVSKLDGQKAALHDVGNGEVRPLWKVEKDVIQQAISVCNGNIVRAAALLEVSPSTIYRKMQNWQ